MTRFEPCGRHPRPAQDRAPESFRIRAAHKGQQGLGVPLEIGLSPRARSPLFLITEELAGETLFAAAGQAHLAGKEAAAKEVHAPAGAVELGARLEREFEPGGKEGFDLGPGVAQVSAVVAPKDEVVHVADIGRAGQGFFDEAVERGQVVVGEMLAGEVADGQAFGRSADILVGLRFGGGRKRTGMSALLRGSRVSGKDAAEQV